MKIETIEITLELKNVEKINSELDILLEKVNEVHKALLEIRKMQTLIDVSTFENIDFEKLKKFTGGNENDWNKKGIKRIG